MTVAGTWNLTIATPIGKQLATLEITEHDTGLRGVARAQPADIELVGLTLTGDRLTWAQSITRPMRLNLTFDVTVHGDDMIGTSKAGRLPTSTVTGLRIAPTTV